MAGLHAEIAYKMSRIFQVNQLKASTLLLPTSSSATRIFKKTPHFKNII